MSGGTTAGAAVAITSAAVWLTRTRRAVRERRAVLEPGLGEMLAYVLDQDGNGKLAVVPRPVPGPGEVLIRVTHAGICNTDLELIKGYMAFEGIIGHEFVGVLEEFSHIMHPSDVDLVSEFNVGQRVVGDINLRCGGDEAADDVPHCDVCHGGGDRARNHCPNRTTLGIAGKDGTFAQYITLPLRNLHAVPDSVRDEAAVFTEPLAAACRIVEQELVAAGDRVAVLGDGKLGLLICEVIGRFRGVGNHGVESLTLVGKHVHKMALVDQFAVGVVLGSPEYTALPPAKFDVVVDATGSPRGLQDAIRLLRPMGTLVLKSTCAAGFNFNTAPFVIDELKVVGSRCGPFDDALAVLRGDVGNDDDDDDDADNDTDHNCTSGNGGGGSHNGRDSGGGSHNGRDSGGGGGGKYRDDPAVACEADGNGRSSGGCGSAVQPGIPVPVDKYVAGVFDLKDIDEAFKTARGPGSLKVLVRMP